MRALVDGKENPPLRPFLECSSADTEAGSLWHSDPSRRHDIPLQDRLAEKETYIRCDTNAHAHDGVCADLSDAWSRVGYHQ